MKVRVGVSKTINLGNFENVKPLIEIEDDALENETYQECYARLNQICWDIFDKEISSLKEKLETAEKDEWINKYHETMHSKGKEE